MNRADSYRAPRQASGGFSLIEVLVAMAVVAVALVAVVSSVSSQIKIVERTRERSFAGWVAANVFNERRLREPFPEVGESTGIVSMANQRFAWRMIVQSTEEPDLRRIDVRVARKSDANLPDQPILSRTEFAARR